MKVTLQFDLPEEIEEFKNALDGTRLRGVLQAFDNALKNKIKHTDEQGSFEECRDMLYNMANRNDILIWS
jgi:hypothetical protein